jgi:hypothetical protein
MRNVAVPQSNVNEIRKTLHKHIQNRPSNHQDDMKSTIFRQLMRTSSNIFANHVEIIFENIIWTYTSYTSLSIYFTRLHPFNVLIGLVLD